LDHLADITAGSYHTCVRSAYGNVYCWGANGSGQVGPVSTTSFPCINQAAGYNHTCVSAPALIGAGFKQVDAGNNHTCALKTDGSAVCWGPDDVGQIGLQNGIFQHSVLGLTNVAGDVNGTPLVFSSISAGHLSSCGTTTDGRLFCWGQMSFATGLTESSPATGSGAAPGLGWGFIPSDEDGSPAEVVSGSTSGFSGFSGVTAGVLGGCVLMGQETICWGANTFGQAGVIPPNVCDPTHCLPSTNVPPFTSNLLGPAVRLSTEEVFTCADMANGTVECFGANDRGQLGSGTTLAASATPQIVGTGGTAMQLHGVTTGTSHACALDTSGAAFCWGKNNRAQLGNGDPTGTDSSVPVAVSTASTVPGPHTYRAIAAAEEHTCAIGTDNHIYCWGDNAWGQLGNHFGAGSLTPIQTIDPH
jgi:alpha-tubulin suppressor-like RCC1 family protein